MTICYYCPGLGHITIVDTYQTRFPRQHQVSTTELYCTTQIVISSWTYILRYSQLLCIILIKPVQPLSAFCKILAIPNALSGQLRAEPLNNHDVCKCQHKVESKLVANTKGKYDIHQHPQTPHSI